MENLGITMEQRIRILEESQGTLKKEMKELKAEINLQFGDLKSNVMAAIRGREMGTAAAQGQADLSRSEASSSGDVTEATAAAVAAATLALGTVPEAARRGDADALRRLLERSKEDATARDANCTPALHLAAAAGAESTLQLLLDAGVHPDVQGPGLRTALHAAANAGHVPVARRLMAADAEPWARDVNGASAMALAAREGHVEFVRWMMKEKNPEAKELVEVLANAKLPTIVWAIEDAAPGTLKDVGSNALVKAAGGSDLDVVKTLIDVGIDPNAKDSFGVFALSNASIKGQLPNAKFLLDNGTLPNAQDENGNTALHYAYSHNHKQIRTLLLKKGANPAIPNNQGTTPSDFAQMETAKHIVKNQNTPKKNLKRGGGDSTSVTNMRNVN